MVMATTVHTTFNVKSIYTKYFPDFLAGYLNGVVTLHIETVLSKTWEVSEGILL